MPWTVKVRVGSVLQFWPCSFALAMQFMHWPCIGHILAMQFSSFGHALQSWPCAAEQINLWSGGDQSRFKDLGGPIGTNPNLKRNLILPQSLSVRAGLLHCICMCVILGNKAY